MGVLGVKLGVKRGWERARAEIWGELGRGEDFEQMVSKWGASGIAMHRLTRSVSSQPSTKEIRPNSTCRVSAPTEGEMSDSP